MLKPCLKPFERFGIDGDHPPLAVHAERETAGGKRLHLAFEHGVTTAFTAIGLHAERREELAHTVTDFDASALRAYGFRTYMDHDETGSRAVGKRLVNPAFAVIKLSSFQKDADISALALECLGVSAAAWAIQPGT